MVVAAGAFTQFGSVIPTIQINRLIVVAIVMNFDALKRQVAIMIVVGVLQLEIMLQPIDHPGGGSAGENER